MMCFDCLGLVPTKLRSNRSKQPWINAYIRRLSRKKQRLYNLAKFSNSRHNWEVYRTFKRKVQGECRKAYNNYIGGLIDEKGSVTKKLWSYIKNQRKDHCGVAPLKVDGVVYNDSLDKAKILNHYFTVFTLITMDTPPLMNEPPTADIDPIQVDINGIVELLNSLETHKAAGPDEIPAQFLKEFSELLAPSLTVVFQASLNQCSLPSDWKRAYIVPIFKKGNRAIPNNYRPISLTCICSKILEHIVYSHVFAHLSHHNILCDQQHGFRCLRSCESQLILTVNDFAETLNNGEQSDVIFLDFSKAFDKVSHYHLFHKLHHYGIRGDILDWIKNFMLNRSQCVVVDGQQSDLTGVSSGVPQGTVLTPLLFLCFINDLPNRITSKIKLYADDVLLYTTIHSQDDCHRLQQDLNTLEQWAADWKMSFNLQKCEFLRITNKKHPILAQYTLQSKTIKEVTHAKYLGVTIDKNLSWSEHIKQITKKANNTKCFLQRNLSKCPLQVKSNCYKALIKPILEYAATVWS